MSEAKEIINQITTKTYNNEKSIFTDVASRNNAHVHRL